MDVLAGGLVAIVALAVWLPQLKWGLPSRQADKWLFGGRPAWSGEEIVEKLLPLPVRPGEGRGEGISSARGESADPHPNPLPGIPGEGTRGADVDSTPIVDRSRPVLLNDTDAKRASIVQRFRLMSGQPDEFIQFKALAEMAGRSGLSKFDPRLYQYGGLWIYPVGGLVRAAMAAGWIESPPSGVPAREFYLDRPDAFGKFYIVGRAYSMAWGVVAALAVYALTTHILTRGETSRDATRRALCASEHGTRDAWRRGYWMHRILALLTALAFIALPSVQTSAHEAKPHLAGAALCLLAALAATRFVDTERRRWLLIAGALCGAAMAMVVSMVLSLAVLPAAAYVTRRASKLEGGSPRRRDDTEGIEEAARSDALQCLAAIAVAFLVYFITNPFVLINAVAAPYLLRSNLGNSTAMYGVRGPLAMIPDAWRIAGHAMTPLGLRFALAAVFATLLARVVWHGLPARDVRPAKKEWAGSSSHIVWIAPSLVVAIQFVLLAAGKPAEYARFGLVVWAALCVAMAVAIRNVLVAPARGGVLLLFLIGLCLLLPPIGLGRHGYDAWQWADRDDSATQLEVLRTIGESGGTAPWRLGVAYEPAPWSTPPVNLFDQDIFLVRATPAMLEEVDAFIWPVNLDSQCIDAEHDRESLDWRQNRFGHRAEARDGDDDRWRGGW